MHGRNGLTAKEPRPRRPRPDSRPAKSAKPMKSGKKAPAARYKVVEEHPAQALVHRASIAGAVLLALIAGFFLGAHKGEDVIPKKHTKISRLESHVSRSQEQQ